MVERLSRWGDKATDVTLGQSHDTYFEPFGLFRVGALLKVCSSTFAETGVRVDGRTWSK